MILRGGLIPAGVNAIRRYPIAIFQVSAFALHHENRAAWILLGLALTTDHLFRRLEEAEAWLAESWKVMRFVQKHKENTFKRFGLRQVLDEAAFRRFRNELVPPLALRWKNKIRIWLGRPSVDDEVLMQTRLFSVGRGSSRSRPCPTSFMTGLGGYVFLTEHPDNIKGVQKFNLLHELGHLAPRSKFISRRGRSGIAPLFSLIFWSVPQLLLPKVTATSFFAISVGWFFVTIFRDVHGFFDLQSGPVLDEIRADQFAFLTLTPREVKEVAKIYADRGLSADPTVKDENLRMIDRERSRILSVNLKEALSKQGRVEYLYELPQHEMNTPALAGFFIIIVFALMASHPVCNAGVAETFLILAVWTAYMLFETLGFKLRKLIDCILDAGSTPASFIKTWTSEPKSQRRIRNVLGYESNLVTDIPWAERWRRTLPSSILFVAGLVVVNYLNGMPDQNWCVR